MTAYAALEDWESVLLTLEAIQMALETLEFLVPLAHWESAGQVAWMFLTVIHHAAHETVELQ